MGWSELLLVGMVALIVVGPKDLPVMFRALGKMTAKVKRMAREFSSAMNDAADSTGMKDMAKDFNDMTSSRSLGIDRLDAAAEKFDKWDPTKATKVQDNVTKVRPAVDKAADGSETAKLSKDRAEAARKIHEKTAQVVAERKAREEAAAAEAAAPKGGDTA